jgi:hypothetical protein
VHVLIVEVEGTRTWSNEECDVIFGIGLDVVFGIVVVLVVLFTFWQSLMGVSWVS